jgi:hypothetical protein
MRTVLTATLAICVTIAATRAQETKAPKPNDATLLQGLKSSDGGERLNAFYQLRSSPSTMRSSKVRAALIDLIDREVQDELINRKEGEGESEGGDEYMADLTHTVASFADGVMRTKPAFLSQKAPSLPIHTPSTQDLRFRAF